jgi:hypothetical protein
MALTHEKGIRRFDLSDALWQDRRERGRGVHPPATRLKDPREDPEHD